MNVTYKVRIDEENNGEVFWDHIHTGAVRDGNLLAGRLRDLQFGDEDGITLTDSDLEWVTSVQGWTGGPEYAPNPLLVEPGE